MKWDARRTVINGAAADADPIATPGNVLESNIFSLPEREPISDHPTNRCIVGLHAPTGETVDFELYALDIDDQNRKPVDRRWSRVFSGTASGGLVLQSDLATGAIGFVGGGLFYLRVTAETVTADRELVIRATS